MRLRKMTMGIWSGLIQYLCTVRFWLCVLGIALICVLSSHEVIQAAIQYPEFRLFSSLKQIEHCLIFDRYKAVLVAMAAGAGGCGVAADFKSGRMREILSRVSLQQYLWTVLLVVLFCCVMAVCLGFLLGTLFLYPLFPLRIADEDAPVAKQFMELAKGRLAVFYLLLLGINFALSAILPIIVGMALTVFCPSAYIAVGGSVVTFYIMYSFSLLLPSNICYSDLSSGLHTPGSLNAPGILLWHLGYWGILIAVFWSIFSYIVRRRYENGNLI